MAACALLLVVLPAGCDDGTAAVFDADLTYEPIAEVGGQDEDNDLFTYGSPIPLLVDSAVVAFTDQLEGGSLTIADILTGSGWSSRYPSGSDGPGELSGRTPWLSTSGDTVKTLGADGRVAARRKDGRVLYDSIIPRTIRPGMMSVTAGLAGGRRVAEYHFDGDTIRLGILIESASGEPLMIPLGTVRRDADGGFTSPYAVSARGDCIVYVQGNTVTTLDVEGRQIAERRLPWRAAVPSIDGSGRVWVRVFGGASGGSNLMLFTRRLELVGRAIIPGFRDAFGDFVLSTRRDSLDLATMVLSRLVASPIGRK